MWVRFNLGGVVQPGVDGVTSRAEIRLAKLVLLGPAEWRVAQPLLDDGVEPGQEEVEARALVGSLQRKRRVRTWWKQISDPVLIVSITLHMRATGMLLKVRSMLALTPGGGSNTKIRPARSRLTGTWQRGNFTDQRLQIPIH